MIWMYQITITLKIPISTNAIGIIVITTQPRQYTIFEIRISWYTYISFHFFSPTKAIDAVHSIIKWGPVFISGYKTEPLRKELTIISTVNKRRVTLTTYIDTFPNYKKVLVILRNYTNLKLSKINMLGDALSTSW